jgi:hypothetical protein
MESKVCRVMMERKCMVSESKGNWKSANWKEDADMRPDGRDICMKSY